LNIGYNTLKPMMRFITGHQISSNRFTTLVSSPQDIVDRGEPSVQSVPCPDKALPKTSRWCRWGIHNRCYVMLLYRLFW